MKRNIVLIGMPASGKSTVGKTVAKKYGMKFIDGDTLIEERYGKRLREIIAESGNEGFLQVEGSVLSSIEAAHSVIAPGGSCIYEEEAMQHLREIAVVIYLQTPFERIAERIGDPAQRGVVLPSGYTLLDLYNERTPLCEKYAHFSVDTSKTSMHGTVEEVYRLFRTGKNL